jgi:hypothetical protein
LNVALDAVRFPRAGIWGGDSRGFKTRESHKMRKLHLFGGLCVIAFVAIWAGIGEAATINARSGSSADIQAAVNLAKSGDTVAIPSGRFLFTGQVYAPDGIHIKGAGMNSTYLIKNDNLSAFHAMITVDAKTGKPFIFSDMTLQGRLDALQGTNRTTAVTSVTDQGLIIEGAAKNFRVYNSRFTKFLRAGIELVATLGTVRGEQTGVIYQNQFIDNWYTTLGYGIAVDGYPGSWDRTISLGTANAVFIEDNYFELNRHCVTASDGANYVARYNTIKNNYQNAGAFDAHGYNSAWPRGTRSVEIYKNTVTNSIKRLAGVEIRGGSGAIWGNSWSGVSHGVILYLENPPSSHPLTSYAALDQIGYKNDLYLWSNTSSGDTVYLNPTSNAKGIDYWIKQGRDYYLNAISGYKPYTYPHPLRSAGS